MTQYTHKCLKCKLEYVDEDPDDYLCETCNEQRKVIAREIDAKLAGQVSRQVVSALAEYYASPKVGGFVITRLSQ